MAAGAGGIGGKEAREMYLIQFPGDEEDEGEMLEDESSLSGEGEETANIKEEVRDISSLRGGGESGTASLHCLAVLNMRRKQCKYSETDFSSCYYYCRGVVNT